VHRTLFSWIMLFFNKK